MFGVCGVSFSKQKKGKKSAFARGVSFSKLTRFLKSKKGKKSAFDFLPFFVLVRSSYAFIVRILPKHFSRICRYNLPNCS
jgi:hypothetical protein